MTGEKKRDIFAEIREGLEGYGEFHDSPAVVVPICVDDDDAREACRDGIGKE